jgi:type II secretory pathway pseudopilin PulG
MRRRAGHTSLRRRIAGEAGMTLVELAVSVGILVIALTSFMAVIPSVQNALNRQANRSQSNDQVRLAVEEMDREIRSGNLLYDPKNENDPAHGVYPYMALRVYTQSNADTRIPGNQCVQWRILNDQLQRRAWSPSWQVDGIVEDWRVVASSIVNRSVVPVVNAFQLDPDPAKGSRTLILSIVARASTSAGSNTPVQISQSVTGRDTEYGYPSNVCAVIPPY